MWLYFSIILILNKWNIYFKNFVIYNIIDLYPTYRPSELFTLKIFYCQTNTDKGSDTSYKLTRSSASSGLYDIMIEHFYLDGHQNVISV